MPRSGKQSFFIALTAALSLVPQVFAQEPTAPADPAAQPAAPASDVSDGPLMDRRKQLFAKIQEAKAKGVGIGGYLAAFKAMEEQVKGGDGEDKLGPRIDSIHRGLSDQMKRADILKIQRPAPPQGSQITGSGPIGGPVASGPRPSGGPAAGGGAGGDAGGAANNPFVEKLKQKFPGATSLSDIPEDQIPEPLRDKLKDPGIRSKIEQKIKERMGGN